MGRGATRYAALVNGAVDAVISDSTHVLVASKAGYRELINFMKEDWLVHFSGGLVVREDRLRSERGMVKKFLRGAVKGLRYMQKSRSGTLAIMTGALKMKRSTAIDTYDMHLPVIAADGTVSEALQRKNMNFFVRIQGRKDSPPLGSYFDFSLTREVNKELDAQGWKP